MALLTLDRDAPGRTLEWRRVSPAFAPRCAPRSRVWLFVGGFALPPGVIGSPLVVHIYVIGFAPPNVVLARDFFRVGLPAGDWSACDSECTRCDSECTPCDSMGQGGTQLVGARHSFGRHQNCTRPDSLIAWLVAWVTRSTPSAYSHAQSEIRANANQSPIRTLP